MLIGSPALLQLSPGKEPQRDSSRPPYREGFSEREKIIDPGGGATSQGPGGDTRSRAGMRSHPVCHPCAVPAGYHSEGCRDGCCRGQVQGTTTTHRARQLMGLVAAQESQAARLRTLKQNSEFIKHRPALAKQKLKTSLSVTETPQESI